MLKRLMQLAAMALPMALLFASAGCGSIGQGNTRTESAQKLDTKDTQGGTKFLKNRQEVLASKVSEGSSAISNGVADHRYIQNTGKSKTSRPTAANPISSSNGRYVQNTGKSKTSRPTAASPISSSNGRYVQNTGRSKANRQR